LARCGGGRRPRGRRPPDVICHSRARLDSLSRAQPPKGAEEIQAGFEESVRGVGEYLNGMTEQKAQGKWRPMVGGKEILTKPRIVGPRSMFNPWYRHRGQLSVSLRMLDVPVIYSRSADENSFA